MVFRLNICLCCSELRVVRRDGVLGDFTLHYQNKGLRPFFDDGFGDSLVNREEDALNVHFRESSILVFPVFFINMGYSLRPMHFTQKHVIYHASLQSPMIYPLILIIVIDLRSPPD